MDGQREIQLGYIETVLKETICPMGLEVNRTMNGRFCFLVIELKDSIRVSLPVPSGPDAFSMVYDGAMRTVDFINGRYREDLMMTEECVREFLTLPGRVEFIGEDRYAMYHRIALIAAQERFGHRLVSKAEYASDRTLVLHTREGLYYIQMSDFKKSLKEVLDSMGHLMRKPIRPRFDKICKENRSEKG